MREIIFRGKRVDNGEWIYGDLQQNIDAVKIREQEKTIKQIAKSYEVVPETVGQNIGLTDNNGKKIYEGDIVRHIQKYELSGTKESTAVVEWHNGYTSFVFEYTNGRITAFAGKEYWRCEVIGNIYDNPELIER